jgi:truncated hemoglobin YjbI/tellurite resistance-related uncharacterized protein
VTNQPLTEAEIKSVVHEFYSAVRADTMLMKAFVAVVDWEEHLGRMEEFWGSLMLTTGRYKGNPVAMHLIHSDLIEPRMFERWTSLWTSVTNAKLTPSAALEMQEKAKRVAARLQGALFGTSPLEIAIRAPEPSRPYRSSPVFDESSIPQVLRRSHTLKSGTWAALAVIEGSLRFHLENGETTSLSAAQSWLIAPEVPHYLEITNPVKCQLHFYDHRPASF